LHAPGFGSAAQEISQNSDSCRQCDDREAFNKSVKGQLMPVGTVKFFNTQKGFGFIQPDDGSKDVFVHITAVERAGMRSLAEGQKLSYEIVTERGKQAAGNLQPA
jgi:CspA family cold shock protein